MTWLLSHTVRTTDHGRRTTQPSGRPPKGGAPHAILLPLILALLGATLIVACGADVAANTPSPGPAASVTSPAASAAPFATLSPTPPVATSVPTATLAPSATSAATGRQLRLFTRLWESVRDTYVYADFNGLDWDEVYRRYRARIEAGVEDEAFYQAMREMIDELRDDHSAFYSPEEVAEEEQQLRGQFDYVGIGIYVTTLLDERHAVLLQVFRDSPAERAGLKSHDRILAVDGVPVIDANGEEHLDLLIGPTGSEVRLTVQTPGQEPRDLVLQRAHVEGQLQVEALRLPGTQVGYLLIPTFWDQTIAGRVREGLESLLTDGELEGLIVDMRINGGGLMTELQDTLALFTGGELGAFVSREAEHPLLVEASPVGNSLELPLVVLVGRETESFGEIFSGVLQERGRARVVGRTTGGNVEILWPVDLEDGSRAWIASETFLPPSGANWEETGIIPDVEILLDWDDFTPETDLQLQAALEGLRRGLGE
jgi:carboxyl-terminal processing protease